MHTAYLMLYFLLFILVSPLLGMVVLSSLTYDEAFHNWFDDLKYPRDFLYLMVWPLLIIQYLRMKGTDHAGD